MLFRSVAERLEQQGREEGRKEAIEEGHTVEADLDNGILLDQTTGKSFHTAPFPPFIQTIITNGGLIASIKKGAVK